ncbi:MULTISPECIES: hypothetical protein [Streptacidiphilus]|uniref:Uncharacterized protein n=1 Tax=Streptacidiphilus cavernicola TaxID=3342716 RepID=A0ABV6V1A7_9ACTN|nr:hypothetical protein [Streptacidiphilus jeojiense]
MELRDVLTERVRLGQLGPVANGAAWATVTQALGEPFEVAIGKRRSWPRLFAYGDLEISVCSCKKIIMVCLQTWRDVVDLPVGLVGRETFPGQPTYAEVTEALDRAGCVWQLYEPLTFDTQCSIQVPSTGVNFTFEIPEGEDPLLNIVGLAPRHHDCPAFSRTQATP